MTLLKINHLKEKIAEKGLTIAATERIAGLKRNYIQNLLYGKSKRATKEAISAISEAIGCSPRDIIENYESEIPLFSNTDWDEDLAIEIIKQLSEEVRINNISVTFENILIVFKDIYYYCIKKEDKKIDKDFIKWVITKHYS